METDVETRKATSHLPAEITPLKSVFHSELSVKNCCNTDRKLKELIDPLWKLAVFSTQRQPVSAALCRSPASVKAVGQLRSQQVRSWQLKQSGFFLSLRAYQFQHFYREGQLQFK